MKTINCNRPKVVRFLLGAGVFLGHGLVIAAVTPDPLSEDLPQSVEMTADANNMPIEEITVQGERAARLILEAMIEAEDQSYAIFNELNSTDEFDMICEKIVPPGFNVMGTRIKKRVCMPRYMADEPDPRLRDELAGSYRTRLLNEEAKALALEHPELAEAMIRSEQLWQRYRQVRMEQGVISSKFQNNEDSED